MRSSVCPVSLDRLPILREALALAGFTAIAAFLLLVPAKAVPERVPAEMSAAAPVCEVIEAPFGKKESQSPQMVGVLDAMFDGDRNPVSRDPAFEPSRPPRTESGEVDPAGTFCGGLDDAAFAP